MKPKTTIVPVSDKGMLRDFIEFPLDLYKNCDKWVPAFEDDEYKSLGPENPSLAFCERELFLFQDLLLMQQILHQWVHQL